MIDLGTLGGDGSHALEINERGEVIGYSRTAQNRQHACLWRNGGVIDLNSLVPPDAGWELSIARGINDQGLIVGDGFLNGQRHMFLLTPD